MIVFHCEVEIARRTEEVFAVITRIDFIPILMRRIKATRQMSVDPIGVGTTFLLRRRFFGVSSARVTEYEPNSRFAYRVGGRFPYTARHALAATKVGTMVSVEVEATPSKLIELFARRSFPRGYCKSVKRMAPVIEKIPESPKGRLWQYV